MLKSSFLIAKYLLLVVVLAYSVEAIQFECNYPTFRIHALNKYLYVCNATVINSSSSSLESVTGIHEPGKSNDDVEFLWIWKQNLTFVAEGIDNFFKNLIVLTIITDSLTSISANDLRPFPRLLYLNLAGNRLTSIDGDLFTYTPLLQIVSFDQNQIQQIGKDLVTNLNDLRELWFNGNICINQFALTRTDVLLLASQLTVLCPAQEFKTTDSATITDATIAEATTTDQITSGYCLCDKEIKELYELNRDLGIRVGSQDRKIEQLSNESQQCNSEIKQLQHSYEELIQENIAFEERLLEVEIKLLEVGSMPCSN